MNTIRIWNYFCQNSIQKGSYLNIFNLINSMNFYKIDKKLQMCKLNIMKDSWYSFFK